MKKFLITLLTLCSTYNIYAGGTKHQPAVRRAAAPSQQQKVREAAPTVTPEGEMHYYEMKAYIYESIGLEYIEGMANKVCLAPDGKTVYIGSIFPNSFRTDDMWLKGTLSPLDEGRQLITIDSKTPFFEAGWDEIYVGEAYYDEDLGEYGVHDIQLIMEPSDVPGQPGRIYIDDDVSNYSRCLIAYEDDYGDIETVDVAYCVDMKPYEGDTTATAVPATAERKDYIYYSLDTYGTLTAIKGTVAVAPSAEGAGKEDYYFDTLLPNVAPAWVKGTRSGSTITAPRGQFLGADCGYYLYASAFFPTSYDQAAGQYIGTASDITFSIDSDGVITFDNPQASFITALQNDGKQYDCVYENRLVPYTGDTPAVPSDPTELSWDDYSATGAFALDFVLNNVSTDGTYLNPECLGYYIYVDGEKQTFRRDTYAAIDREEMTLVPYGYTDAIGYDFYSAGTWNEVFLYISSFETLGIQAVYTVGSTTCESNIVTIDRNSAIEVVTPVGIGALAADAAPLGTTRYDLYGRPASHSQRNHHNISICADGRKAIK